MVAIIHLDTAKWSILRNMLLFLDLGFCSSVVLILYLWYVYAQASFFLGFNFIILLL